MRDNYFIMFDGHYDKLTFDGVISCLCIIGSILRHFREKTYTSKDISAKLLAEGFSFVGLSSDLNAHRDLVNSFLNDLANSGFLTFDGSTYVLANDESLLKVVSRFTRILVEEGFIESKKSLEIIIETVKTTCIIDDFSIGLLIKELDDETRKKLTQVMGRHVPSEQTLIPLIREQAVKTLEKDLLASAAFWQLEAELHYENGENKQGEQCTARSSVSLAIFCKRKGDHKGAAKYYERAAEIYAKYPEYQKNSNLQLANALSSKGRYLTKEGNFLESSTYYLKAAELFDKLGNKKEATFCRFMNLKSQGREQASYDEFIAASKLLRDAGNLIKPLSENHYLDCMAHAAIFDKEHAYSLGDFKDAAKASKEAAEFFGKAKNQRLHFRALGSMVQLEGLDLESKRVSYIEIAEKFKVASEYYDKALDFVASAVAYADSMKNYGLEAKNKGDFSNAIDCFSEGKRVMHELAYSCDKPNMARNYQNGEIWFEAMIVETEAQQRMLEEIQQMKKLDDVARMLAHSADLFTKVGDFKHANINSTFIIVTMAIDAFHENDNAKANELIHEAKCRLPSDFAFTIFEGEVRPGWQPLRYALETLGKFDKYARQIETEKGFSFESRIRELLRKIFPEFTNIEPKVFKTEAHEIGMVFPDNTPIEIDAFGANVRESNLQLFLAEIKNISKPVGSKEMHKFLKKIEFITQRYLTVARLQSLNKVLIPNKVFVSSSGFESPAVTLAEKNNIQLYGKDKIKELLKKHSQFSIP